MGSGSRTRVCSRLVTSSLVRACNRASGDAIGTLARDRRERRRMDVQIDDSRDVRVGQDRFQRTRRSERQELLAQRARGDRRRRARSTQRVEHRAHRSCALSGRIEPAREVGDASRRCGAHQRRVRRHVHRRDALGMHRHVARRAAAAQQRLTKPPQPDEIEILLARERARATTAAPARLARKADGAHRVELRLREVGKPMTRGVRGELVEVERHRWAARDRRGTARCRGARRSRETRRATASSASCSDLPPSPMIRAICRAASSRARGSSMRSTCMRSTSHVAWRMRQPGSTLKLTNMTPFGASRSAASANSASRTCGRHPRVDAVRNDVVERCRARATARPGPLRRA